MEKNKVIFAGLGQCGCILADEMKSLNQRYSVMYLNSAIGDLNKLVNVDLDSNAFIYSAADGTGRDRVVAQEFLKKDAYRLNEFLKRFSQYNVLVAMASLDGGTGSGSLPLFIRYVKKALPHITINIVGVLPKLSEDNLKLKNTISCLKELESVMDLINDIKFIDNNKRDYFYEINEEALRDIDAAYGINGNHIDGSIDTGDSYNVNNAVGYGVILKLPSRSVGSGIESISMAINNSVFAIPENLLPTEDGRSRMVCEYAAINVKEGSYDYDKLKEYILTDKTVYTTYNNKKTSSNYIVLGGADMPTETIELIKSELEDRKKLTSNRPRRGGFGVGFSHDEDEEETISTRRSSRGAATRVVEDDEDDEDLFDPDFFRF